MRLMRCVPSLILVALIPCLADTVTLYSIGPDATVPFPVPRTFNSLSTAGVATPLFDLGDGSLGFNGGLAFNPDNNLFYAIANDWLSNSSLVSFSSSGSATLQTINPPLGGGFVSGLAYDTLDHFLYGISNDGWTGESFLNQISLGGVVTPLGSLGFGFRGGLTFSDGLLYAFSDIFGAQRQFNSITPDALHTVTPLFALGGVSESFNGGVVFNAQDGLFYAISNDSAGHSSLQTFKPDGSGLANVADIPGGGFLNVGLVAVTATAPVPEPSLWMPVAGCLIAGALVRFRRRRE